MGSQNSVTEVTGSLAQRTSKVRSAAAQACAAKLVPRARSSRTLTDTSTTVVSCVLFRGTARRYLGTWCSG